ncbi:MAG: hypothetical protein QGH73_13810 [Rhodospirillales bacterium]|nr:hypothetical protein [Rhodospirillales bacterium]MDP6643529.1 hypothetical protein [Rhodospirillales bacterium]MDP6842744.1 hypothetical protein [Rhodospirillales bacterium]
MKVATHRCNQFGPALFGQLKPGGANMATILPQQKLLLELLIMSGDIAVADDMDGTILERTLKECEENTWIKTKRFGAGFNKVTITEHGRRAAKVD